jgi:hypothetical protein
MNANVGSADRIVRIVLGLALISLWFLAPGAWRWLAVLGVVLVLTALVRLCPAYTLFGINSCKMKE